MYDEIINYFGSDLEPIDEHNRLSLYYPRSIYKEGTNFSCIYHLLLYRKALVYDSEQANCLKRLTYGEAISFSDKIHNFQYSHWKVIRENIITSVIEDMCKVDPAYKQLLLDGPKNYVSLGGDKELDAAYRLLPTLSWCGTNLYGLALRNWCVHNT